MNQHRYQGKVDNTGRFYDDQGRFERRTDDTGRTYDGQGRYEGRMTAPGATDSRSFEQGSSVQQKAITQETSRVNAPMIFCTYGDKNCQ